MFIYNPFLWCKKSPSLLANLNPFRHSKDNVDVGAQFFETCDNLHFKSTKWRFLFLKKFFVTKGLKLQLGTFDTKIIGQNVFFF